MAKKSLNKVLLIGNVVKDPIIRKTSNGTSICTFTIATNNKYKKPDGSYQEVAHFHRIVAWSKLADVCAQKLKKGTRVFVEGELRNRNIEVDGTQKQITEIRIVDMQVLRQPQDTNTISEQIES